MVSSAVKVMMFVRLFVNSAKNAAMSPFFHHYS
jgi:hypothetical protein